MIAADRVPLSCESGELKRRCRDCLYWVSYSRYGEGKVFIVSTILPSKRIQNLKLVMALSRGVLNLDKLARDSDVSRKPRHGQTAALAEGYIRDRYFRWKVNENLSILGDYLCWFECYRV